jgi:hypothetical protein
MNKVRVVTYEECHSLAEFWARADRNIAIKEMLRD